MGLSRRELLQILVIGAKPESSVRDGWLNLRVPSVLDHEVIAVDL